MEHTTAILNGFEMANLFNLPASALLLLALALRLNLRSLDALRPASLLRASAD